MSTGRNGATGDSHARGVRDYYDRNTHRFLRFGHGGASAAIHRAVWGPGVTTRPEAITYVNRLILAELSTHGSTTVLDLGCGVGGTIAYLQAAHPAEYCGVTLSPVQADLASRLLARSPKTEGAGASVRVGDFHRSDDIGGPYDAIYAVEALLHADPLEKVVENVRAALGAGGVFVACDDFLNSSVGGAGGREARWIATFRRGWHADGLTSYDRFLEMCRYNGLSLTHDLDLTPHLELGRPRDKLIRLATTALARLPISAAWWQNMVGGDALQRCLRAGLIGYRFSVFRAIP